MNAKTCRKGQMLIKGKCRTQKRKVIAIVDHEQQYIEKNISFWDYPMKNDVTDQKLRKNFDYYYDSWEEYIKQRQKDGKDWQIPKK